MIQQIGNTKTDNKQLTKKDIFRIMYASSLNFFYTNSMFAPWHFGIFISLDLYYVKKVSNNNYQYSHSWAASECNGIIFPHCFASSISTITEDQVKTIHRDLVCSENDDERVLITCCYRKANNFNKKKLGFILLEPTWTNAMNRNNTLFLYELIIVPKPGLFPTKVGNN